MLNIYNLGIGFLLTTTSTSTSSASKYGSILLMVAMFVGMYFLMIRPQKKKQKDEQEMRDSIQIGDEITTIGGIIGKVVTVKDDSLIVEVGADRTKLKIARWSIQTNNTSNERLDAERKAAEEEKKSQQEQAAIDAAINGKTPKKRKSVKNRGADDSGKIEELKPTETEQSDTSAEAVEKNNE